MYKLNAGRDWPQLINDLLATGLSTREVANRCCTSASTVCRIAAGYANDPEWTTGQAIIRLHRRRCAKATSNTEITGLAPEKG